MRLLRFASLIPVLVFVGCSAPSEQLRPVPIAGGHMLGIPFGPQGPLPGKADGYLVLHAGMIPAAENHQVTYQFVCSAPPGAALQRIQVDDISEEQSAALIDDPHPWLTDNLWHLETAPIDAADPRLAWIYTVTPTMRVYRFTITDKSGHQTIMHQVVGYPDFIKSALRHRWGEKY